MDQALRTDRREHLGDRVWRDAFRPAGGSRRIGRVGAPCPRPRHQLFRYRPVLLRRQERGDPRPRLSHPAARLVLRLHQELCGGWRRAAGQPREIAPAPAGGPDRFLPHLVSVAAGRTRGAYPQRSNRRRPAGAAGGTHQAPGRFFTSGRRGQCRGARLGSLRRHHDRVQRPELPLSRADPGGRGAPQCRRGHDEPARRRPDSPQRRPALVSQGAAG